MLLGRWRWSRPPKTTQLRPPALLLRSQRLLTGRAGLPFTCQHSTLTTFGRKNTWFLKTKMNKETCFIQACFKK